MRLLFALLILWLPLGAAGWTNWLGNQSSHPLHYYEPKSVQELTRQIKTTSSTDIKMQAVGNGFSISEVGLSHGAVFNLKHLRSVLSVDLDKHLVRVESGISLHDLNRELERYGLSLANQAAIEEISLGGAIATASHGSGNTGSLSSLLTSVELMNAEGIISTIRDEEDLAAARVSLGSLGIIYAVTLQCEPLFYLKTYHQTISIDQLMTRFYRLLGANDYFQCSWNVESGLVTTTCMNRSSKEEGVICYKALNLHTLNPEDKDLFSEIAIPLEKLPEATAAIRHFAESYLQKGIKIEDVVIRFVKAETSYLSPASGRDVAYLTMSTPKDSQPPHFYEDFEDLMLQFEGRPHWGKVNFVRHEKALKLYGQNLEKFILFKQKVDPRGLFSNPFMDRLLGLH